MDKKNYNKIVQKHITAITLAVDVSTKRKILDTCKQELELDDANLIRIGQNGDNPLIWASRNDDIDLVRSLVKSGASLDFKDEAGYNAIETALYLGREEIVDALVLEFGYDPASSANLQHCYEAGNCKVKPSSLISYLNEKVVAEVAEEEVE